LLIFPFFSVSFIASFSTTWPITSSTNEARLLKEKWTKEIGNDESQRMICRTYQSIGPRLSLTESLQKTQSQNDSLEFSLLENTHLASKFSVGHRHWRY
jgi:hypothetical protein